MKLTKIQTTAVCLLLTVGPWLWQEQSRHRAKVNLQDLQTKAVEQQAALKNLELESERLRLRMQQADARRATAQARLEMAKKGKLAEPASIYKWDPDRQLVRVPKTLIQDFNTINDRKGTIDAQISEVLQLKPDEKEKLQSLINQLISDYQQLVAKNLKQVEPRESELFGHKLENTIEFEIGDMRKELTALNQNLLAQAKEILDPERVKIFEEGMKDWLKIEDNQGWNSGMTILGFAHRCCFYKPTDEMPNLMWSASIPGRGMVSAPIGLDEIPTVFEPFLKDWIAEIQETRRKQSQSNAPKS